MSGSIATGVTAWRARLDRDAATVECCVPDKLLELHNTVVIRAREAGAQALILSGSTARGSRTDISDLDYHLVGHGISTRDLSRELDLHALSEEKLTSAILDGDDFVQWSLRFGLVIFDTGVLQRAALLISESRPWPDVERKMRHAAKSVDLARRFVATGDEDGALVQVRTALSLAARARLLADGVFPLSRAELPDQLRSAGYVAAGNLLASTIYGAPSLEHLSAGVREGEALLGVMAA